MSDAVRPADDIRLLRRQMGYWEHRDIADEQTLQAALMRWPLLAELAGEELSPGKHEAGL